ncbi:MAG: FGGY family carbohydrate kinase [Treponema sp.]|nr:FGGY family carbohydrate kinase [Treponema sp.]
MEHIIAIDQGTSGSKALIISEKGEIVSSHTCPFHSYYPKPGFVEQKGNEIIESIITSVKQALYDFEAAGNNKNSITAVGISNQRESFLLWDEKGIPLSPVIVWQCKRSVDICLRLQKMNIESHIIDATGLRIDPYFSGTKLLWLIENDPFLREKVKNGSVYFGTIDTWLVFKFTGNYVTDCSNASRTLLMDLDQCKWSPAMEDLFEIKGLHLPEIRPSSGNFGETNFNGILDKPIPITSIIGDSHAACFGEGCFSPGTVKATMGTGSSVVMNTGKRTRSQHGMVSTICWSMEGRRDYALEGVIVSCGSTVNWILEKLKLAPDAAGFDAIAESVPDSGGVTFIPAFSGLGGPYWQMGRKAEILGITLGTDAAHIVRAALEAYPFQLKDVISSMEKDRELNQGKAHGAALQWIRSDGGLTHSRLSMQIIANLLKTEVRVDRRHEASAMGAAMLGFIGKGTLSFSDVESLIIKAPFDTYSPKELDKGLELSYALWRERVSY